MLMATAWSRSKLLDGVCIIPGTALSVRVVISKKGSRRFVEYKEPRSKHACGHSKKQHSEQMQAGGSTRLTKIN